MPELTNAQFAQGLRELAEIYESDERMEQPQGLDIWLNASRPERFRESVKALALGGKVEKLTPSSDAEYFYRVRRVMPSGVTVTLITARGSVCRKVQKMVMTDVWECPDSILDPEAA